jgi:hypothetical protein
MNRHERRAAEAQKEDKNLARKMAQADLANMAAVARQHDGYMAGYNENGLGRAAPTGDDIGLVTLAIGSRGSLSKQPPKRGARSRCNILKPAASYA